MNSAPAFVLISAILLAGGCTGTPSPYSSDREQFRNSLESERLNQQAAKLIYSDPDRAKELLQKALTADMYNGPAHNNLGVIHLERGELYDAANEFEWARKLMPGHPDPRLNLALTLERGGRIDDAIDGYDAALEVYPDHLPTVMALARCQIRHDRIDDRTEDLLRDIAMRGDEQWRRWARTQQLRLGRP